ncbi:Putative F-box/LRR-repeat protein At5g38386 [Linum perenne]
MAEASGSGGLAEDKLKEEELDYSSRLPDELIFRVLSNLTFKEVVRTSVISKRWINLWKSTNLVLDFDAVKELKAISPISDIKVIKRAMVEKRQWFKDWVSGVVSQLEQHSNNKGSSSKVTKFRVVCSLTNSCNSKGDIDRWLEFALSNRLESLHLDFRGFTGDEIVEHMVANCPLLEELVLKHTTSLNKLRVVGSPHSPLPLRHLEIKRCFRLEFVEIAYTPSLVRLIYDTCLVADFRLNECSSLVDLTLECSPEDAIAKFKSLSSCASQLRFLLLKISSWMSLPLLDLVEYTCLERLTIQTRGVGSDSILGVISLINQCPRLHTLQVFFHSFDLNYRRPEIDMVKTTRESIKVVEIVGFSGYTREVNFVNYVMDYFVGLERIVIDRGLTTPISDVDSIYDGKFYNKCNEDQARVAKEMALDLKSKASPTIEFIVI